MTHQQLEDDESKWPNWRRLEPLELLMVEGVNPNNPVVITALFSFAESLTLDWIKSNVLVRLIAHPRFRSTVQYSKYGRASFVPVHDLQSLQNLVLEENQVPANQSEELRHAAFTDRINTIQSLPLPLNQPLWRIHFFPNFGFDTPNSSGCTVVLRLHHVLGDGIALVKYCASHMTDNSESISALPNPHRQRHPEKSSTFNLLSFLTFCANLVCLAGYAVLDFIFVYVCTFFPDSTNVFNAADMAKPKFALFVPPSRISLNEVKKVARHLSVTVNDLLLACLAGSVREYLLRHKEPANSPVPKNFHVALAYNRHVILSNDINLCNRVILIPLKIPVHEPDRERRLRCIAKSVHRIKTGCLPWMCGPALSLLCLLPRFLRVRLWCHMTRRVSCVWTNIPGPSERLEIAQKEVTTIAIAAPGDGEGGSIFTMFTYGGLCSFCISGDPKRIQYPEELSEHVLYELKCFAQLCGM